MKRFLSLRRSIRAAVVTAVVLLLMVLPSELPGRHAVAKDVVVTPLRPSSGELLIMFASLLLLYGIVYFVWMVVDALRAHLPDEADQP